MVNFLRLLMTWQRLKNFQHKDLNYIRTFQLNRFKRLIHHVYERIPMYRELYNSHSFQPSQIQTYEDIQTVPIISRDIMQSYSLKKRIDAAFPKRVFAKQEQADQQVNRWKYGLIKQNHLSQP